MRSFRKETDERIIKTKDALVYAIINLIKENKTIKVLDVCQKANVTPMTYYHHFSNKTDLLQFAIKQQLSFFLPIPIKLKPSSFKHLIIYFIKQLILFFEKNRSLIICAANQKNGLANNSYISISIQTIRKLMIEEIILLYENIERNDAYIWATTIVNGLFNLLFELIKRYVNIKNINIWTSLKSMLILMQ